MYRAAIAIMPCTIKNRAPAVRIIKSMNADLPFASSDFSFLFYVSPSGMQQPAESAGQLQLDGGRKESRGSSLVFEPTSRSQGWVFLPETILLDERVAQLSTAM
jgi:hypothetical protein